MSEKIKTHYDECWKDHPECSAALIARQAKEIEKISAERNELLSDLFMEIASYRPDFEDEGISGWWDTCARTTAKLAGDRLVEFGLWERQPGGVGRRWLYRPIIEND